MENKKEIRKLKETKRGKRISIIIIILTLMIGVIAFIYAQQNESLPLPLEIIAENSSLTSTINFNFIYDSKDSSSSDMSVFILSDNSLASSSVSLLLEINDSKTALCNAVESESCFSNNFKVINCFSKLDQSKLDCSTCSFNSSGISIDNCAILTDNKRDNSYLSFLVYDKNTDNLLSVNNKNKREEDFRASE